MSAEELYEKALLARKMSYSPYSHFSVGAAVIGGSGSVYTGCNIENASYPAGICAERTAISKAVSEGEKEIIMVAVAGGPHDGGTVYTPPCGICRQVLAEFGAPDMPVVMMKDGALVSMRLRKLLPEAFELH